MAEPIAPSSHRSTAAEFPSPLLSCEAGAGRPAGVYIRKPKDLGAGIVFLSVATFFILVGSTSLEFGTTFRMGPGFFPLLLAGLLAVLALAIMIGSVACGTPPPATPIIRDLPVRGLFCVVLAPVVFAFTVRDLGFAPAVGLAALAGAAASRLATPAGAIVTATAITLFCIGVFIYGLGLPLPLIGPAFG